MKSNRSNFIFSAFALTGATSMAELPTLGQITVANAAMNYAGALAQDVQGYLAGLPSSDESARLELLFPGVQTNDFFQFAKSDDEAYLTESDNSDIRAIGASFKRVQYKGTTVIDSTQQKGLTMRVDHKQLPKMAGKVIEGWENRYAEALRKRLIRADIVRGLALIDAAANNTAVTFSASTNPDGLLRAQMQRTRVAMGDLSNAIMVIGNASWQGRIDAYEAAARANTGVANHSDYDEIALARYLQAKRVHIADGIKQTAKGATKADVLGLANYSYSTSDSPILDDPSNVRRAYSPVKGSGEWAVAIQEYEVYTDITVWHESKIFIPQSTGIRKTTVTIA
jgi:hypothetical protein